ncbi:MAG TPA: SRPBCC family protein [Kofleriaceae bacterium]|jgi:hypothetical protein|nr:SRPBCC family protein [Kofleriaceae bacterium]
MIPKNTISAVLDMPLEKGWLRVRDFNGLPGWHPAVIESTIERGEPHDRIGCVRSYRRRDGLALREQLLALDDVAHSMTYRLLDQPIPVKNYVATLRLTRITESDRTFAEWQAWYDCAASDEATLREAIDGVFRAGLEFLNASTVK